MRLIIERVLYSRASYNRENTVVFFLFRFEADTKDSNALIDQHEADIRDLGKKIQGYEVDFDETNDKLNKALTTLEEAEKNFKNAEEEVCSNFL